MIDMQVHIANFRQNAMRANCRCISSFPLTWGSQRENHLNDEYEEYAIHDYELPYGWRIHFHYEPQSTMGNGITNSKNYTGAIFALAHSFFKHWRTKRTSRGYYHSFRLWWYVWRSTLLHWRNVRLGGVPRAWVQNYIDYQAYGRDLNLLERVYLNHHRFLKLSIKSVGILLLADFLFYGVAWAIAKFLYFLWKDWLHEENMKSCLTYLVCKGIVFYQWFLDFQLWQLLTQMTYLSWFFADDIYNLPPFHDRGSISQIILGFCGFHMVYVHKNFWW